MMIQAFLFSGSLVFGKVGRVCIFNYFVRSVWTRG